MLSYDKVLPLQQYAEAGLEVFRSSRFDISDGVGSWCAFLEPAPLGECREPVQPIDLSSLKGPSCLNWQDFADLFGEIELAEDALERFKSLPSRSDHIEEARRDCAYVFLEQVFLPAIRCGDEINLLWIVDALICFKNGFHKKHPEDFPHDVSLSHALDRELSMLALKCSARVSISGCELELDRLIIKANDTFSQLLGSYSDLYML